MERIKFEKEQIKAIYDEVDRRMLMQINDNSFENDYEIMQERRSMHQGVYSVLCALAINWPEVRHWTDEIESQLYE